MLSFGVVTMCLYRPRLEEANLLLKEEKLTIGEVAKRVGYSHQGHFSKLFFATYGVYPKELIRS
ncbi:transcriptional regulator, AraC family [hydrothermal vent metagenome]|uniref:Transcriptional regulator, AraC family n=1 Tax=hydrothermal vent metagenome TaxID=652676 RepID=A0A1W1EAA2_9ZZZZ